MRKYIIIVVTGMAFLYSGCSLSRYYSDKTLIELEQYENPMIWKEVFQMQVSLWPLEKTLSKMEKTVNELEKTVNEMRDELATAKLSSIQANYNIESLQAEIQQIKNESLRNKKTSIELPIDLDKIEGKSEILLGLLQKKYGYTKDKAELEYKDGVELAEIVSRIHEIRTEKTDIMAITFIARYGRLLLARHQERQIAGQEKKHKDYTDHYFDSRLSRRTAHLASR